MHWNLMLIGLLFLQGMVAATGASHATALSDGQVAQLDHAR